MNTTSSATTILTIAAYLHYELIGADEVVSSFDGNKVGVDAQGKINKVEYSDGSIVCRHESYVLVQSAANGFWFGDKLGHWFAID